MRNFINKFGIHLFIILLLTAGLLIWFYSRPRPKPGPNVNQAFYVDEETSEESVLSSDEIPPLPGKDGKLTVVRAMKFSCEGGKNPRTLYLLKYTPEAQAKLQSLLADSPRRSDVITAGELIRSPEPHSQWIPSISSQAEAIRTFPDCPSGQMVEVFPQK